MSTKIVKTMNTINEAEHYAEILAKLDSQETTYVQAHISSISFPKTLSELYTYVHRHGRYNIEDIIACEGDCWTVPRNSKVGDVVLFYHAKTANVSISRLKKQILSIENSVLYDKETFLPWIERAEALYKQYGGKVFAIGRVTSKPQNMSEDFNADDYHFKGRIFADILDIKVLNKPIDISLFNEFITISRHRSTTPLANEEYCKLRNLIKCYNDELPDYFMKSCIGDFKLASINKSNFIEKTKEYRNRFLYENEFRSYYVNNMLSAISGSKVYSECMCCGKEKKNSFVDNVFYANGKYYLLEVKLNIKAEKDLFAQLNKYVTAEYVFLDKERQNKIENFEKDYMFVIDTDGIYKYETTTGSLFEIVSLNDISDRKQFKEIFNA